MLTGCKNISCLSVHVFRGIYLSLSEHASGNKQKKDNPGNKQKKDNPCNKQKKDNPYHN